MIRRAHKANAQRESRKSKNALANAKPAQTLGLVPVIRSRRDDRPLAVRRPFRDSSGGCLELFSDSDRQRRGGPAD